MFRVSTAVRLATLAACLFSASLGARAAETRPADERIERSFDPAARYRTGPQYGLKLLDAAERVYRSRDGRYFCKRPDGSAGLITGNVDGDALGDAIQPGHSRTVQALIYEYVVSIEGQPYSRQNHEIRCR
jgi:hypothetical protein